MGTPQYQPTVGTMSPGQTPEGSYVGGRISPSAGVHKERGVIANTFDSIFGIEHNGKLSNLPAAALARGTQQRLGLEDTYPTMPTAFDPDVVAAGRSEARQRTNTSPAGRTWTNAKFATRRPMLIGSQAS